MTALLRQLLAFARARRRAVLVIAGAGLLVVLLWALLVERSLALTASIALQALVLLGLLLLRRQLGAQRRELRRVATAVAAISGVVGPRRAGNSPLGRLLDDSASVLRSLGAMRLDEAARHHELGEHFEAATAQTGQLQALLGELQSDVDGAAEGLREDLSATRQQHPADTAALVNLYRLVTVDEEMPLPGGWAVGPPTLLSLVREVLARPEHPTIVECGSGTSTVWIALALRQRGGGRVIALEHTKRYVAQTRGDLDRAGLAAWAEVRLAPIEEQPVDGERHPWYAARAWQDLTDIDVLVVDGPPGSIAPQARFPALPLLGPALRDGATVLLDDVSRPNEAEVAKRWRALDGDVRLEEQRRVDRSVMFRAMRTVGPPQRPPAVDPEPVTRES